MVCFLHEKGVLGPLDSSVEKASVGVETIFQAQWWDPGQSTFVGNSDGIEVIQQQRVFFSARQCPQRRHRQELTSLTTNSEKGYWARPCTFAEESIGGKAHCMFPAPHWRLLISLVNGQHNMPDLPMAKHIVCTSISLVSKSLVLRLRPRWWQRA